ncbi:MAG: hypothetical protein ACR2LY_07700 [Thermoleophilaceae bacterium]
MSVTAPNDHRTDAREVTRGRAESGGSVRWSTHLVTALLSAWLIIGLFVDGWAHHELPELETFFTPWHALLYSGLAATAGWISFTALRHRGRGRGRRAVLPGYGLGVIGAAGFAIAGLSDLAWHTAFGIERDLAALLSPPHLALALSAGFMITTPARALWRTELPEGEPVSFVRFLPVLLSFALTAAAASFFLAYLSSFQSNLATRPPSSGAAGEGVHATSEVVGLASVLVTNALVVGALLLMARRWALPFGAATFIVVAVALLNSLEHSFESGELLLAALAGGVITDLALRSRFSARWHRLSVLGLVLPAALWSSYFAVGALAGELAWPVELWSGAVLLACLSGLALSALAKPMRTAEA